MLGYGGNTSCATIRLADGSRLVLDAGTGIRRLGVELAGVHKPIHVLLTHLHLDHIMGLMFFGPLFDPEAHVTVWGPPSALAALRPRLARYLSAPLSPIEIRDLPADVTFRTVPSGPWRLGSATVEAGLVNHRGPTLGYRIEDDGRIIAYLPDHEPGLGQDLARDPADWISGLSLAQRASLLIHDAQYTEREYAGTIGWGHATIDQALDFARRAEVEQLALFHHDPTRDDAALDAIGAEAAEQVDCRVIVAREGSQVDV
jgi:ribonuclease BN (tRNA processing enzyme)